MHSQFHVLPRITFVYLLELADTATSRQQDWGSIHEGLTEFNNSGDAHTFQSISYTVLHPLFAGIAIIIM